MTYLDYFKELCQIPHGSGNTKAISDYCVDFAKRLGLAYRQDEADNVVIVREASAGKEQEPGILLQGHLDMVAVKEPGLDFDFTRDGLRLRTEGDFLFAEGTSLGADNGIAVAYMLAILEDESLALPRLECVFTSDEEVGMVGAKALDVSGLTSRYMINMDSEDEGVLTVSCAGGASVRFELPVRREMVKGVGLRLRLSGFTGGHSGTEIHKNRANAIRELAKLLLDQERLGHRFRIRELQGGFADNVIPSTCSADLLAAEAEAETLALALRQAGEDLCRKYRAAEPGVTVEVQTLGAVEGLACEREDIRRALELCCAVPNGVLAMSQEMEGMVETSSNLGTIALDEATCQFVCAPRSAKDGEKEKVKAELARLAGQYGAKLDVSGDYPGWPLRADSLLTAQMSEVYEEMFGEKLRVEAIHAGLECGLFSQRLPHLDIVSMGSNLYDVHSTRERLSLSSAERCWQYLCRVLTQLHS